MAIWKWGTPALGLPADQQVEGARHVVARGLTVRQTEALVRQWLSSKEKPKAEVKVDPDISRLEQRLAERPLAGADQAWAEGQRPAGDSLQFPMNCRAFWRTLLIQNVCSAGRKILPES